MKVKVLVVTGPTGGHFFPGLALAEKILSQTDWEVVLLIPPREMLKTWVKRKGVKAILVDFLPFSLKKIHRFFPVWKKTFLRSWQIIRKEKPHLVVGTGSYTSVPVILSGWLAGSQILLHEQNVVAGKANRFLALLATEVAVTFPETKGILLRKYQLTGFPLLSDFRKRWDKDAVLKSFGLQPEGTTVLIMGGSQSARALNELAINNIKVFQEENLQCLHLAGPDASGVREVYRRCGVPAVVFDFSYEMDKLYSACDVAIARAGAGTLVELVDRSIPALLIPYPFAGSHQVKNASWLLERQACFVLEQTDRMNEEFPAVFKKLLQERHFITQKLSLLQLADNSDRLFHKVRELVQGFCH